MRPESSARLWDALRAAKAIVDFTLGVDYANFAGSLLLRSAVERQFEILGEALNHLRRTDPGYAAQVPDLGRIVGMRNVIAHEYGEVDEDILWVAATGRVPQLITVLESLAVGTGLARGE